MLTRIVKMTFRPEHCQDFRRIFERVSPMIRAFPGCKGVKLYCDVNSPAIFFTYSIWDSETDLEAYRQSELFSTTWTETKKLFAEKAEAWSLKEEG
ncbi:MAG: antibiotic biosynthesis monooxygenase [Flavobacteriales bacterium]|nr:antibiotic biosynthesis monooxygenase [Flavobacteriales bacterium]